MMKKIFTKKFMPRDYLAWQVYTTQITELTNIMNQYFLFTYENIVRVSFQSSENELGILPDGLSTFTVATFSYFLRCFFSRLFNCSRAC